MEQFAADVKRLCSLFEQELKQPVSEGDDFFDLGGDSLMAQALVTAINDEFGSIFNVSNIMDFPTPADFARALSQGNTPGDLINPLFGSTGEDPLLFVHGALGGNFQLRLVGDDMRSRWKIAGVRARGYVRGETFHATLDEMLNDYMDQAEEHFGSLPKFIAGNCAGGMIALELASRIYHKTGEQMTLFIIDPPATFLKYHQEKRGVHRGWYYRYIRVYHRLLYKVLRALRLENTKEGRRTYGRLVFYHIVEFVKDIYPKPFPCNMLVFVGSSLMDVSVPGIQTWADDQVNVQFLPLPGRHNAIHRENKDVIDTEILRFVESLDVPTAMASR